MDRTFYVATNPIGSRHFATAIITLTTISNAYCSIFMISTLKKDGRVVSIKEYGGMFNIRELQEPKLA